MCIVRSCGNPGLESYRDGWLKEGFCQACQDQVAKRIDPNGELDRNYLADYLRIKALLDEEKAVLRSMQWLGEELGHTVKRQTGGHPDEADVRLTATRQRDRDYIRFSRVLEYYESYCSFPPSHRLFAGSLEVRDILRHVRYGLFARDGRAGRARGDFTHRLQWHAIMRAATDNFRHPRAGRWKHTALNLFVSLGWPEAKQAGVWQQLFDQDDTGDGSHFTNRATLHKAAQQGGFGFLSQIVLHQYTERLDLLKTAANYIEDWKASMDEARYEQISLYQSVPMPEEMVEVLGRWREAGQRDMGTAAPEDSKDYNLYVLAARMWDNLMQHVPMERLVAYRSVYAPEKAGAKPPSDAEVAELIEQSYRGFNPLYLYVPKLGMERRKTA